MKIDSDKKYIEIKRLDNGNIIHSGEYAYIAECFNAAVKEGKSFYRADLRSADLRSADLRSADLRSADLRSADLRSADLRYADLSYADLRYADLSSADLSSADLRSADLRYADLSSANNIDEIRFFNSVIGDGVVINSMQFGQYKIAIMGDVCCGGCTTKTCKEWLDYDGSDLNDDDKAYLEGITKPYIRMILAMRDASK